jgi:hypothetical protein
VRAHIAPTGNPLPIAFAMVTTSGTMPACWKPNHLPVRPKPGLHLVDHQQQPALVAQRADVAQVLRVGRQHATLALHRLEQHRGHRRRRWLPRARRRR